MCAPTRHTAGLGAKQNASPLMKFRGEARINVPRFHPACRKREAPAALCPPVTGRPRPAHRGRLGSGTAAALRGTLPPLRVPLCAPLRGFFSVSANFTWEVYHPSEKLSRASPFQRAKKPPSPNTGRGGCLCGRNPLSAGLRQPPAGRKRSNHPRPAGACRPYEPFCISPSESLLFLHIHFTHTNQYMPELQG